MDDYPYATLGADRCPGFPALLRDVLHRFSHTGTPTYRGHPYCEFERGLCEVHVDIPTHPSNSGMTAWFTMATCLDDTLERAAHQALTKFCERHLPGLISIAIALFPVQNEGNAVWSERLAVVGDPERSA
jgi:hypothetical protein